MNGFIDIQGKLAVAAPYVSGFLAFIIVAGSALLLRHSHTLPVSVILGQAVVYMLIAVLIYLSMSTFSLGPILLGLCVLLLMRPTFTFR